MSIVVLNDIHFSHLAPECRLESYREEILSCLHEAFRIAKEIGAEAIGCTGDWFHRKGNVTHAECNDILAILSGWKKSGIEPIGILGNHDIPDILMLNSRAAGAFVHAGVLRLLDHSPWIGEGLYVTGTSFFNGCDGDPSAQTSMYGADRPRTPGLLHVHLSHGALMTKGTFFEDYTSAKELIPLLHEANKLPDVIVCGHLHFPQKIVSFSAPDRRDIWICRIGSVGQVARDDLDRRPHALIIDPGGTPTLSKVPIGPKPKAAAPAATEETESRIKDFVKLLREEADLVSMSDSTKMLEKVAEKLGYGKEVVEVARKAIEQFS